VPKEIEKVAGAQVVKVTIPKGARRSIIKGKSTAELLKGKEGERVDPRSKIRLGKSRGQAGTLISAVRTTRRGGLGGEWRGRKKWSKTGEPQHFRDLQGGETHLWSKPFGHGSGKMQW